MKFKLRRATTSATPATSTVPRLIPTPKQQVFKDKDPSNVVPFYYHTNGLMFTATSKDLDQKLILETITKALTPLGVLLNSVEFAGPLECERGEASDLL